LSSIILIERRPSVANGRRLFTSKPHQAILSRLAPINTRIFFRVNNIFFAFRATSLRLIGEKFNLFPAIGAFDIADLDIFFSSGALGKHIKLKTFEIYGDT
jgi:hypothetical protein